MRVRHKNWATGYHGSKKVTLCNEPLISSNAANFWAIVSKTVHPMLSDYTICLSVLSVTLVYCGQMVGWIKTKLGMQVVLGPGHTLLVGDPALPPPKGAQPLQFLVHICLGQMVGWIKMPLGMEVGLGPGDFVLDGDPAPLPKKAAEPPFPIFGTCLLWPNG